jgi:hypothetical protein
VYHFGPRSTRLFALVACAFFGSFASVQLNAQEAGGGPSVRGTVLDQSGNPIEKAAVVVRNEAAKVSSAAVTNAEAASKRAGYRPAFTPSRYQLPVSLLRSGLD